MKSLKNKGVLITGAASGIGRAACLAFAKEGATPLIISDINQRGLSETKTKLGLYGCDVLMYLVDITEFDPVEEMIRDVYRKTDGVDILVNVAGTAIVGPVEKLDMADWKRVIDVNLYGALHTVHAVYPKMLKKGAGHIVNVASLAGLLALHPYNGPYCASKFGLVGFSENLMYEAVTKNIGVSCICPGGVKTPIYQTARLKGFKKEFIEEMTRHMLARAQEPEDTAQAIIKAVKRNEFLVVTTLTAKLVFFSDDT